MEIWEITRKTFIINYLKTVSVKMLPLLTEQAFNAVHKNGFYNLGLKQ